ncbi:MAG TPA: hypothetical protein PK131_00675 [Candidatus Woesebacteria bacterium]|nr:hypothetical protein [Candidatus Woesebacteria bacterium]HRT40013.1 hypothetical protein [Candidatus Woesebacteria bacterium]
MTIRAGNLDTIAPDDKIIKTEKNENVQEDLTPIRRILGHTRNSFSSTLICPNFFDFSERSEGEIIYVVLRPHWFTNISWILLSLVMFLAPLILKLLAVEISLPGNLFLLIIIFWYMVTLAFALEKFISWYFDLSIITNLRVIDMDIFNLLNRKFTEAEIKNIQDIDYRLAGASQTFFNYGSVRIETAGERPNLVFEKIAAPDKILKLLQELCHHGSFNQ